MTTVYVLTSAMGVFDHLIAYESVAVHGLPAGFDVSHLELENNDATTVAARLALRDQRLGSQRPFVALLGEYEHWLAEMCDLGTVTVNADDEIEQSDYDLLTMYDEQTAAQLAREHGA